MSETCNCQSCLDYLAFKAREEQQSLDNYWRSPQGISRRIDSLAQDFSYRVINNAFKIVAKTNNAQWLEWEDKGDSKVCPECRKHATGGRNGFYKVSWFLPKMPVHRNCRCVWRVLFYDPFG